MELHVGTHAVFAGVGVVRVEVAPPALEVSDVDGDRFDVDADDYDLLRPLVSEAEANRLVERLAVVPESFSEDRESKRSLRYLEVFDNGTPDEQVDALRAIMHDPRNESAEVQNKKRFEELVFNELAVALGVSFGTIRSRVAQSVGGTAAPIDQLVDRSGELPPIAQLPEVHSMRTLGAFWIDAVIGAGASGTEQTIDAMPGVWHAYGRTDADESTDEGELADVLLAIHSEHGHSRWLNGTAQMKALGGPVPVEGATLCIADAVAAGDARFADRLATLGGDGVFDGRAVQLRRGGDGSCQVQYVEADGRAVIVVVEG